MRLPATAVALTVIALAAVLASPAAVRWSHTPARAPRLQTVQSSAPGGAMSFQLQTPAFTPGGEIPAKFTCKGEDVSPALQWSDSPAGTESFALIADDPDAPAGNWTHWVIYDLAPQTRELPENVSKSEAAPGGARQGQNDFKKVGYGGPCPPPGKPHRYFFRLYALDTTLKLKPGASRREVESAMQGHILATAEVMGRFRR